LDLISNSTNPLVDIATALRAAGKHASAHVSFIGLHNTPIFAAQLDDWPSAPTA